MQKIADTLSDSANYLPVLYMPVGPCTPDVLNLMHDKFPEIQISSLVDSDVEASRHQMTKTLQLLECLDAFPGAEDLGGFWNVLQDGLDLHKPVSNL